MMLTPIYQALFNKKKLYIIFFYTILIFFETNLFAKNIYSVARVNNKLITNIDVSNQILLLNLQFKNIRNINIIENEAKKNLIEHNIKKQEILKNKIYLNKMNITQKKLIYSSFIKNFKVSLEDQEKIKNSLLEQIETRLLWTQLIQQKYIPEISINFNEINEIIKKKKLNKEEIDKLIISEKNKKLTKLSLAHYNVIKKNYIIYFYDQ